MSYENRNFGLDLARSAAISLVLISHFATTILNVLGFLGVELFFALSGYLIGGILWRNYLKSNKWDHLKTFNFWSRRWWRTLPNYYLFFFITIGYYYCFGKTLPHIGVMVKSLWFGQFLLSHNTDFYGISWSLCIEEWFYFLFPLVLMFTSISKLQKKASFLACICIFYLATILVKIWLFKTHPGEPARQITFARLDAIVSGVFIIFLQSVIKISYKAKVRFFLVGVAMILVPFVVTIFIRASLDGIEQKYFYLTIIPMGFAFCMPFIAELKTPNGIPKFLSNAIQRLSIYSYSIYLSHIYIMFAVYFFMDKIRSHFPFGNLLSKLVGCGITILISALIYSYFEAPLTARRPKELK